MREKIYESFVTLFLDTYFSCEGGLWQKTPRTLRLVHILLLDRKERLWHVLYSIIFKWLLTMVVSCWHKYFVGNVPLISIETKSFLSHTTRKQHDYTAYGNFNLVCKRLPNYLYNAYTKRIQLLGTRKVL